jgi:hypothetical protein
VPAGAAAALCVRLRERTLAAGSRADIDAGELPAGALEQQVLKPEHRGRAMRIAPTMNKPAWPDKVIVDPAAFEAADVYLERVEGCEPGDSGWYVGPAGDEAGRTPVAVCVSDLFAVRPDWAELLALPDGWLVVLRRGGVEVIADQAEKIVWRRHDAEGPANGGEP